ncbi:actin cytoskeleton organization protein [Crepidotus variabilis]|uniref:Actin cytoskeleton organization protein n=1 Tax=Crepidotus variabilis TaxID=179855 RepID=A0A9P6JVC8_9AGAR|nr:actin cytoskeleton organization protein [Crepidotus variabilis]
MSAGALERQIRPIYDALDTGSNKSAIVACNKLLKKNPKNELIKALKALALVRSQKVEESLVLCDEVLESKPTNEGVLTAMMHVLRGLGRHNDLVTMFEEAFKKQPSNEDLGIQTFLANVRAGNWKSAHLTATRMYKQFQEERYLYWSIISAVLQARDPTTPDNMRSILFKLAHRLITGSPTPSYVNAERFHLHLSILRELELWEEADKLLDSDVGKNICSTSLVCNEVRREIWHRQGRRQQEAERAEKLIVEKKDRNWLEFLAILDATLPAGASTGAEVEAQVSRARELFENVVKEDGAKDRSGHLALVDLEHRARTHGVTTDSARLTTSLKKYFEHFGSKACCFEDLKAYTGDRNGLEDFITVLDSVPDTFTNSAQLLTLINSYKLLRLSLPESEITFESELKRVANYTKHYFEALPLGDDLPATELQPADDLMLLAGNAYISLWKLTNDETHIFNAVHLLEFGVTKSKHCFLARLILIRIYRLLGSPSSALEHYRIMQIKQVQHDTLSHLLLSRASTFSLASTGDLTLSSECQEATQIYLSNSQETGEFVSRAFNVEKYSQIPEFLLFEDWLDNSLQRDLMKIEHLRMRLTHEPINSDIIDMELIELKFIFDRNHYDNRDFAIFPDYQPKIQPSLHEQTTLFGKSEGTGWLMTFLKLYIRAFQQASDLDDTVEEKLLIGDRPKQTANQGKRAPLKERLLEKNEEHLTELTADEKKLFEYATCLADWLEPYHDYTRPPPAVVLAEAARQTELKTGHPLKGIDTSPLNGLNGHKKDEEPPAIQDPPELLTTFFADIQERFKDALGRASVTELLHIATLAQEAFLLFVTETVRFKVSSVVKLNKLGALVASFKDVRAAGVSALKEISSELVKQSEYYGTTESRQSFVDSGSKAFEPKIDHDVVFTQTKKINDSRRKVLEGVGKGIARLATTYAT